MRWAVYLWLVVSLEASATPPPTRLFEPSAPQWTLQVTSYGEQGRDLSALFIPFFAGRDFAPNSLRAFRLNVDEADAIYFGSNSDYIAVIGRYNCLIIRYYGTVLVYPRFDDRGLKKRAELFRDEIGHFLAELPEPRPTTKDLDLRSTYCAKPDLTIAGADRVR
jgi:hypothetical protein